jgi:hypothetical protein
MNRRKLFTFLIVAFALAGPLYVAVPYVLAFISDEDKTIIKEVRIDSTKIPPLGALDEDHFGYKVIVVRSPDLKVFTLPSAKGAYLLPYPSAEKPLVSCKGFIIQETGIACENPPFPEHWKGEAKWDLSGKSQGRWMPDLQTADFHMEGDFIVFNLRYN